MDANKQRFWMLADGKHFDLSDPYVTWDKKCRVLRLRSHRMIQNLPSDRLKARELAEQVAATVDAYGTWAIISEDRINILASSMFEEPVAIFGAPAGQQVLDLSMGNDGILYLIVGIRSVNTEIVMMDRSDRWSPVQLSSPGFIPDRIVAETSGGAWALDRGGAARSTRLARVTGMPLRRRPMIEYESGTSRPCRENPNPPRLEFRDDLVFPQDRDIIAVASNPLGQVAFLLWPQSADTSAEILLLEKNKLGNPVSLCNAIAPYSLGWAGDDLWAVMFEDLNEAVAYPIPSDNPPDRVEAVGDRFPLNRDPSTKWANRPFCNALTRPAYYQASPDGNIFKPKPLYRLSMPCLAQKALTKGIQPFNSGKPGTVWHRIYLEAKLPPGTGVRMFLAAADDAALLDESATVQMEDMEHCFGSVSPSANEVPLGSWVQDASEIPFHPGLLDCQHEKDHAGLFTALIQRPGRKVRTLKGRYLRVKLELTGNGQTSPEIAAVRIYEPRFSYLDSYLPELYRETLFGPQADDIGIATGPDFLQRYLCLFEGIFTPLEDKIASAHLVTDPKSAPPEALDWLGSWVGLTPEPGLPLMRKRRMLSEATRLYRKKGTLQGLKLALNIATDNMEERGDIVILEDFRLRRTFATILGADLADEEDPLMMGIVASGNSYVGDTLFLGEEEKKEFLALYMPDIAETEEEQEAIQQLFERLANRITVLVHREVSEEELRLIRRVVELEIPAHIEARVFAASKPLLVGLTALVAVDTYISERKPPRSAQIGRSCIGRGDYVQGVPSLDPRLEEAGPGSLSTRMRSPEAHADNVIAKFGSSFTLDASSSRAFDGHRIVKYIWKIQ